MVATKSDGAILLEPESSLIDAIAIAKKYIESAQVLRLETSEGCVVANKIVTIDLKTLEILVNTLEDIYQLR